MNRQNSRYLAKFVASFTIFFVLIVALKFVGSYKLAPKTSGLGGVAQLSQVDYLFVGSSRTRQNYDPVMLQRATGKRVYLLAYNHLEPVWELAEIRYLDEQQHLRIGTLVMESYPLSAEDPPTLKDTRLFNDAPAGLKVLILRTLIANGLSGPATYNLLVTSNNEQIATFPITNWYTSKLSYRGGYVSRKIPSMTIDDWNHLATSPTAIPVAPLVNPVQAKAIVDLIAFASAHGIGIVFMEPPVPQAVSTDVRYAQGRKELIALYSSKGAAFATVPPSEFPINDYTEFADRMHFSTKGREIYTAAVVRRLATSRFASFVGPIATIPALPQKLAQAH